MFKKYSIKLTGLVLFLLLFLLLSPLFAINKANAESDSEKQSELFSPLSKIEYSDVSKVKTLDYYGEKIYATFEGVNGFSVFDLKEDAMFNAELDNVPSRATSFYDNKTIELVGENLLVTDFGDGKDTDYLVFDNRDLTAKNFTVSRSESPDSLRLITISGDKLYVFAIENGIKSQTIENIIKSQTVRTTVSGSNHTLCADSKNIFFSKDGNAIYYCSVSGDDEPTLFLDFIPSSMTSDGIYLYYVNESNSLERKKIGSDENPIQLTVPSSSFDLGNLGIVKSMCLKEGNLLIASLLNNGKYCVSEYTTGSDNLTYTGFSLSKGNTAFNRISSDSKDVAKSGKNVAVLDEKRILAFFDVNGTIEYKNYFVTSMPIVPLSVAMKQNIIIAYNESFFFTIDLEKNVFSSKTPLSELAKLNFSPEWESQIKTQYDIAKRDFKLDNGKIAVCADQKLYSVNIPDELGIAGGKIKSFAMDFESKEIYFILEGEEVILFSLEFDNKTISEMKLSSFKTSDVKADAISELKIYEAKSHCELYNVSVDLDNPEKLTYLKFIDSFDKDLVLIHSFNGEYGDFVLLSAFDENNREIFVLANTNNLNKKQADVRKAEGYVYVTTPVDMYYLPLINYSRCFSLKDGDLFIRLNKETKIEVTNEITVNNKDFYYGSAESDGVTYTGYIPKDFTVKTLAKQYITQIFSYKQVSKTQLLDEYGNMITWLSDNTTVKLFDSEDGKCYVSYTENGEEIFGYVTEESIKVTPDNTIKIVICISILTFCVLITTVYFVFFKKDNQNKNQ